MKVPFVDLSRQNGIVQNEILTSIKAVYERGNFINGNEVDLFEKAFSKYLGGGNCISCGNGTDALELALFGLGISKGDEVIVPAHTWISTASSIKQVGGTPVFVNSSSLDYNINIAEVEGAITAQTKAIIGVHLYGNPFDVIKIIELAKKHSLFVIEDCAQAHGAEIEGKKIGTFGDVATFSFYPSKNLGCLGDGGCLIVKDKEVERKIRAFKNCGQAFKNEHLFTGRNSRLDTLQAVALKIKLTYLDECNKSRIDAAGYYNENLGEVNEITTPYKRDGFKHVYHIYSIKAERKQELMTYLRSKNIGIGEHYPELLPRLEVFKKGKDIYDESEYLYDLISLPMFPYITKDEVEYVCNTIKAFYAA